MAGWFLFDNFSLALPATLSGPLEAPLASLALGPRPAPPAPGPPWLGWRLSTGRCGPARLDALGRGRAPLVLMLPARQPAPGGAPDSDMQVCRTACVRRGAGLSVQCCVG